MASDGDAHLLWAMEHPNACPWCRKVISGDNRCGCSPEKRPGPDEYACAVCGAICTRGFGPDPNLYCYTHSQQGRR